MGGEGTRWAGRRRRNKTKSCLSNSENKTNVTARVKAMNRTKCRNTAVFSV
jgi:hypothetical protein